MQKHTSATSSVTGGALLIAGCCIGAGMLGLPVLSAYSGFLPSFVVFIGCWLFMVATGLLLLEVNLSFGTEASLITMLRKTLGRPGEALGWLLFLFLFYCLMVAYIAASGDLAAGFIENNFGFTLSTRIGTLFFALFFGALLFSGMGTIDWFNRFLMAGLILFYLALIGFGLPHVNIDLLERYEWTGATLVIPAAVISFGFHNLVPSLNRYFNGDVVSLKRSIWLGSAITLMVYLLWEGLILGIVPLEGFKEALNQGEIATEALKNVAGVAWIREISQGFAFFAIVTSFLAVAISFIDFLADGFEIEKTTKGRIFLICLVLLPPTFCSWVYPSIFLDALGFAGGVGTMILFGILPVLMVWKGRYGKDRTLQPILPGGKFLLGVIFAICVWVISLQLI